MGTPKKDDDIFDEIADMDADGTVNATPDVSLPEGPELSIDPTLGDGTISFDIGPDVEAIVTERDELKDRLLRSLAETENVRKRAERDRREAEAYGGTRLARDLLPIYDNLKRALEVVDDISRETSGGLVEGVELTQREVLNIFAKHGITRIAPDPGEPFDPQLHQAMFEAPVPDIAKGCIIQVMVEGFLLHDRLLRPAQVGVSSKT